MGVFLRSHDISLSLTDGDGKVEHTVGVLESIELFKNLADIMGKRSKNQKLNNLISDKELIYPFGYPDSILNDNITLFD